MEVLRKKLTYREFRELEFDDNDNFWYELINGKVQSAVLEGFEVDVEEIFND